MKKFHLLGILLILLFLYLNIESFGNPFDKPFMQQQNNNNKDFKNQKICREGENCPKSVEIKIREPSASADYSEPPYSSLDESLGEFMSENDMGVNYREIFMKLNKLEEQISVYNNNYEPGINEYCISYEVNNGEIDHSSAEKYDDINCELTTAVINENNTVDTETGCCKRINENNQLVEEDDSSTSETTIKCVYKNVDPFIEEKFLNDHDYDCPQE